MLPFTSTRLEFEDYFSSMTESPPAVRYIKRPRHFSFTAVFRSLLWDCIEYYTPPPSNSDKKTLVLDLDETLIHSSIMPPHSRTESFRLGEWGLYVFKRPGLDQFLEFVREAFEIFVFTHGEELYARPILDRIMPWLDEEHRLYREACNGKRGARKDLKVFGRSPERLILIDDSDSAFSRNPENTVRIPRWCGTPTDRVLIDWVPRILEGCLQANDVRPVIRQNGNS
jgi:Dullard-like phosphatase family protein